MGRQRTRVRAVRPCRVSAGTRRSLLLPPAAARGRRALATPAVQPSRRPRRPPRTPSFPPLARPFRKPPCSPGLCSSREAHPKARRPQGDSLDVPRHRRGSRRSGPARAVQVRVALVPTLGPAMTRWNRVGRAGPVPASCPPHRTQRPHL